MNGVSVPAQPPRIACPLCGDRHGHRPPFRSHDSLVTFITGSKFEMTPNVKKRALPVALPAPCLAPPRS